MAEGKEKQVNDSVAPPSRRWGAPTLVAVLAVAALLRFYHFELIEFKSDEALICDLTIRMLEEGKPATHGLTSGKGLSNFPMFAYLLALPVAVSREPMFLTALVTLANLAAIGLLFHWAARRWGLGVALWAALLLATSPWAVIYSRKIWAQDLLPIFTVAALFGLLRLLDGDKKAILGTVLWAGVAAMTHLSGACAVATAVICLVLFRPGLAWKRFGLAVVALLVLAAPFLYYQVTEGAADRKLARKYLTGEGTAAEYKPSLGTVAGTALNMVNDFGFEQMLGSPPKGPPPVFGSRRPGSVVGRITMIIALAALVVQLARQIGARKRGRDGYSAEQARFHDRVVLLLWLVVPVAIYGLAGVRVYTHYFIVTLPAPFVVLGMLLEGARRAAGRLRPAVPRNLLQALPIAVGLSLACSGAASVWSLLGVIDRNGGARGGYGVALKHKTAAVEYIVAQAGDRPAALVGDTRTRTPLPGAEEYEYLLRLAREKSPSARRPETGPRRDFVIIDLYRYNLSAAELEFVNTLAPRRFGPLLVGALPERELSGRAHPTPPAETTKP